ncbi:hypothetical protein L4D09_14710 [Photobacterium makurazakiensis]|uniref:hypothetical protein n=1 Tax=Photobacterium makurazakiensis TaxID=2910234 RepID=UPI003D1386AA
MSTRYSRLFYSVVGLSMLSGAGLASAQVNEAPMCQPEWHNAMSLQDGALTLEFLGETFKIKPSGQLYFGVHKVKLDDHQMAALADYHRLMLDDLPYALSHSQLIDDEMCHRVAVRQAKENEIQSLIPALKRWQSVTLE